MNLRPEGQTARIYAVSYRLWRQFCGDVKDWITVPQKTDLCTMVRTVVFTAPLAVVINAGALSFAVYAVVAFVVPIWLNITVVGAVAAVIAMVGIGAAAFFGLGWVFTELAERSGRSEALKVATEYYKAKKAKICPIIEFSGGENEAS